MNLRACALVVALASPVAFAPPARADDAVTARTVIVDVDPGATEIDAAKLREAIGKELEATAVAPDDALAPQARGKLAISIDRAGHALVVSYREEAAPITRSVDLPADPSAVARAAVLLAGNLARDEAGELVATLRRSKPPSPAAASESAPAPAEAVDEEAEKLDRLGATLDSHAQKGHGLRLGIEWTMLLGGLAAEGVGLTLILTGHPVGEVLDPAGLVLVTASPFVAPGNFDKLTQYYAYERAKGLPPDLAREDVEQAWLRVAHREHWNRKLLGWVAVTLGGAGAALSTAFVVTNVDSPSTATRSFVPTFAGLLAVDVTALALGVTMLATDGPLESALRQYEASAGYLVTPSVASQMGPRFTLTQGGAVAGVGGRF